MPIGNEVSGGRFLSTSPYDTSCDQVAPNKLACLTTQGGIHDTPHNVAKEREEGREDKEELIVQKVCDSLKMEAGYSSAFVMVVPDDYLGLRPIALRHR